MDDAETTHSQQSLAIYVECTSLSRTHVVRTHKARPFRAHTSCGIRPPVRCHPSRPGSEASPFSQRRRRAARGEDTHSPLPSGATNPPHSIDPACRDTQRQHNCQRLTERAQRGQGCAIFFPLLLLSCFSVRPRHDIPAHPTRRRAGLLPVRYEYSCAGRHRPRKQRRQGSHPKEKVDLTGLPQAALCARL